MNVFRIADFFIDFGKKLGKSDNDITNLKLNKLLYFSQGAYLAKYDKPLFSNKIEAWTHGPVVVDVYKKMQVFGKNVINSDYKNDFSDISEEKLEVLIDVLSKYAGTTAWKLREITHTQDPWIKAINNKNSNEISNEDIKKFFKENPIESLDDFIDDIETIGRIDERGHTILPASEFEDWEDDDEYF